MLGTDGAFGDDDRFHPLSPNYFVNLGCDVTDGAGHGFVNVGLRNVPASGLFGEHPESVGGCEPDHGAACRRGACSNTWLRLHLAERSTLPRCPAADMRQVYFGLLGPRARSRSNT